MPSRSHPRPPLRLSRLRDIGFALWDPIGLLPPGETWEGHPAADEYDAYLARATSMLRDGASDDECVRYLLDIEVGHMGLTGTSPPGSAERLAQVVSALRRYAEELDGP